MGPPACDDFGRPAVISVARGDRTLFRLMLNFT
jgi:hypothetical protein